MHSKILIWFVLPALAWNVHGQVSSTNKQVRLISLSETLDLALANNLNIKIQRLVPQVARYNVEVAKAGRSTRVGLQNLSPGNLRPGGNMLTVRDASYDPVFFAQAVKTYESFYNPLTFSRRSALQKSVNDVNRRGFENLYQTELATQSEAQRDLLRAETDILSHNSDLASIVEGLRLGRITPAQAQILTADENAQFQQALANRTDAQIIINDRAARLAAAQAGDAQSLSSLARATETQNFLNSTPVGGEIPSQGVIDPETGEYVYGKEVNRLYDFATGFRGALPAGTIYELRLDTGKWKSTLFDREYASIATIAVAQPLLRGFLTDEARTTINVGKKDLQIAEYGFQFTLMEQLTLAETAYYDLIFQQSNVNDKESALQLATQFLTETAEQVKNGMLPALDLKQAEALRSTAEADLIAARRDLAVAENAFKNMITDDYAEALYVSFVPSEKLVAVPEKYNLAESWAKALQHRPEYNQARLELEKQNILLRFAKNQLLPTLDIAGSLAGNGISTRGYGRSIGAIDDGSPTYWFGAIMTMNLWNKDARGRTKIAKAGTETALYMMQNLEQNILTQVDNNVRIAQSEYSRVAATRSARQFAEAALEAEQTKLKNGQGTTFLVVQAQKNLAMARFTEISALAAYNKALAQLSFSEGSTLERHKIRVDFK